MSAGHQALNGDLAARVAVDTAAMDWSASPSGTVWRKRVHLVGPPESGQVTSVVRYQPDASFPSHDHPEGEEILVLDGVFSDEHGDWPAGTYLLNPEGFRHTPFSKPGCTLLVKLRQFPGRDREHHVIDTTALTWQPGDRTGILRKSLYAQRGFSDRMALERWDAGAEPGPQHDAGGIEYFVISGAFQDEDGAYEAGAWLRLPAGRRHTPRSIDGCTLYVKRGGLSYLRGAA
ncbi:MAG: cupin domain-containing protein [Pseudomonadota bacterium]